MKSFKKFLEEEKEKASIQGEADRRLKFEREVMGMEDNTTIEGNRRLQLVNQITKEREADFPEEAENKRFDKAIQKHGAEFANMNIPYLTPWLKGKVLAAANRLKGNPTERMNSEISVLLNYPKEFDTGVLSQNTVRVAPSATAK
jgi:hypothetical protein